MGCTDAFVPEVNQLLTLMTLCPNLRPNPNFRFEPEAVLQRLGDVAQPSTLNPNPAKTCKSKAPKTLTTPQAPNTSEPQTPRPSKP